jgi:hypothetical protein
MDKSECLKTGEAGTESDYYRLEFYDLREIVIHRQRFQDSKLDRLDVGLHKPLGLGGVLLLTGI